MRVHANWKGARPAWNWWQRLIYLGMLVSMLPLFGTDGLERLLDLHRYSGLAAVVALILHFYSVLLQRFGLR